MSNLVTLYERRNTICKEYFNKIKNVNHKLHHLLPGERNVPYMIYVHAIFYQLLLLVHIVLNILLFQIC